MITDVSFPNTMHYKVWIKDKALAMEVNADGSPEGIVYGWNYISMRWLSSPWRRK